LNFFAIGDSKTASYGWPDDLITALDAETSPRFWSYLKSAHDGVGLENYVSDYITEIDNYNFMQDCPSFFVNLGINNITGVGGYTFDETTNKASLQAIIDACVANSPTCKVYLTKVWGQGYDTDCDTFAGWVDDLVALNANAYVGIDERIVLKGDDDGATNTSDGIHPSAAGEAAYVAAWKTVLGY